MKNKNNYICETNKKFTLEDFIFIIFIFLIFFLIGVLFKEIGLLNINYFSLTGYSLAFGLGIGANFSTCGSISAAIFLSMANFWKNKNLVLINFILGRIIGFSFLGFILGMIGKKLIFITELGPYLIIFSSILMIVLSFQMLGIKYFSKIPLPSFSFINDFILKNEKKQNVLIPFVIGFLTIFIPCGFSYTAQSLAISFSRPFESSLILFLFALGSLPSLLLIVFGSKLLNKNQYLSDKFIKTIAVLIIIFSLYLINSQLSVFGFKNFSDLIEKRESKSQLPQIINGKQVIKMEASFQGYNPNYFKVKVGIPVRWEIKDIGASGCTNGIIAKSFFVDQINLTPGKTSVKEFIPEKPGIYKFSCWMGMASGIIEVVN